MQLAHEFSFDVTPEVAGTGMCEKRLLEMVSSGRALPDVLQALCCFVEEISSECHCGVYQVDWCGARLRTLAAPTLPASFNQAICALPVHTEAGPCAKAACLKTQVISLNLECDPRWQASTFGSLAATHGLRSCWSTPIYSQAGQVLGTFAVFKAAPAMPTVFQQDLIAKVTRITSIAMERAQGEVALRRSEEFLVEAQRLSSTGSFSWRLATDEITWSKEMYRLFEIERDVSVTLETMLFRVHPDDLPLVHRMICEARREGRDFEYEYRLLKADFSVKYLHVVARGTRNGADGIEFIGAIQDVTERRLSQMALDQARSELAHMARVTSLGLLTASIAHELNQPLAGIITNASTCLRMLSNDPPNVVGALETAHRTIRDGNHAAEVITRLRAMFAKKAACNEKVDLNEATREVIALSLSELRRNRVTLRTELADELPLVMGDRIQLQQVILNLVLNASESMSGIEDRTRKLLIQTVCDGDDSARLAVQDVGIGLGNVDMDKLFEAFYTTKNDGMGIGLSVSRSIIETHRGRLWANHNDGPGTTFSFSIPLGYSA